MGNEDFTDGQGFSETEVQTAKNDTKNEDLDSADKDKKEENMEEKLESKDGYKTLDNFNVDLMKELVGKLSSHAGYATKAKAQSLDVESDIIALLGSPGLVQYLVYRCTQNSVILPDSAKEQLAYFSDGGYKTSNFESCYLTDNILRIGFCEVEKEDFVALFLNGVSYESAIYEGPCSRPASDPVFEKVITKVFVIK